MTWIEKDDIRKPLDVQLAKITDSIAWLRSLAPLSDDEAQLVRFAIYDLASLIGCEADLREKVKP